MLFECMSTGRVFGRAFGVAFGGGAQKVEDKREESAVAIDEVTLLQRVERHLFDAAKQAAESRLGISVGRHTAHLQ